MKRRRQLLDWSDRSHWTAYPKKCRGCQAPTFLRDDDGRPCHKVCAERETRK